MTNVVPIPIAARVGATNVYVAQAHSRNWLAVCWHRDCGPWTLGGGTDYVTAVGRAKGYVANHPGAVLDLPKGHGLIQFRRGAGHGFEVTHESRSGESFALLRSFGPHQRDDALRFALDQLGQYSPCRLGEVDQ